MLIEQWQQSGVGRLCRRAGWHVPGRYLLLALMVSLLASCTEPKVTDDIVTAQPEPPVAVVLDNLVPEVQQLLQQLLDAARQDMTSGRSRGDLGMAYEVNGFPDGALASYIQAGALDPGEPRWPYYEALMLAKRGQQAEALQAIDRTLAIDSGSAAAWMWRGTWCLDLGLLDQAETAFANAEARGEPAAAIASRARLRLHQGRPREALALLEPLSRAAQYPSVFQLLGRAYRETGRLDEARVALAKGKSAQQLGWMDGWEAMKRVYEVGFQAELLRAQALDREGKTAEAIIIFEQLIKERPDNEVVINQLSSTYTKDGQMQRAFFLLLEALDHPPVHYTIHLNIAGFYEARGDLGTALAHLDQAIARNPVATLPYVRKGLLLQQQRDLAGAEAAFESAMRLDARDPFVFFYAADVAAQRRNWPEAISRFREAVRIDPSFALGYLNLGLALGRSGQYTEARSAVLRSEKLGTDAKEVAGALAYLDRLEAQP